MVDHISVPVPDDDSKVFWDGVAQGKLLIQRCDVCQQFIFYPRSICPHCFADTLSWVEARGTGTIYSYTVVHWAFGPFAGQTPFMVAIVELTEGVRMMTRIMGNGPDAGAVRIGAPVQVVFVQADEGVTLSYQRHWGQFFPALVHLHRTTFVRQAANLGAVKERLWCAVRDDLLPYDPTVAIVDSFPVPVCQFARAYRCRRFRGEARYGTDHTARQTFYGFRLHARVCWPGVITQMPLTPANLHEGEVVLDLTEGSTGLLLGDRNYWLPSLKQALRKRGIGLVTPFRSAKRAPAHSWSRVLGRVRYWIDTVCGQLVERCQAKRVWARDLWHLRNRLLRMVLMHTLAVLFTIQEAAPPLQVECLIA